MRFLIAFLTAFLSFAATVPAQEDEIVANLAGGRIIIQVLGMLSFSERSIIHWKRLPLHLALHKSIAATSLCFSVLRSGSFPLLQNPFASITRRNASMRRILITGSPAHLKLISSKSASASLKSFRPLVTQLHHKIDLKPDDPLLEIILIGYAPQDYNQKSGGWIYA